MYGPRSPFEDKAVADAFWAFKKGLVSILIGVLPAITARKATAARAKVAEAFLQYYQSDALLQYYQSDALEMASAYAKNRYHAHVKNKITLEDMARFEVGGSLAVLVNTVPASFGPSFSFTRIRDSSPSSERRSMPVPTPRRWTARRSRSWTSPRSRQAARCSSRRTKKSYDTDPWVCRCARLLRIPIWTNGC